MGGREGGGGGNGNNPSTSNATGPNRVINVSTVSSERKISVEDGQKRSILLREIIKKVSSAYANISPNGVSNVETGDSESTTSS